MNKAAAYIAEQRQTIVEQHAGLVKRIAHHLKGRLPANVQLDDLIQSGMIGLLEASKNYDGTKGASFETFAGIRIRGAMLDEIRKGDWAPRSVHRNSRRVADAITSLEQELGRDALDTEIAQKLDITVQDYHHILNEVSTGKIIGLEDLGVSDDVISGDQDTTRSLPFDGIESERFQSALVTAIKSLPEREALVLSLYYDEELNLREIGEVLDVSESRISQIHSQAMHRLKARMKHWTS
ncbi:MULTISPECIES: RNA polymerase sigma factor FliA [Corallincola]|uniref:RNA polymerase sigma factor FliA n=3 Tax=Corallincola TaxID=1775176 RepID=A0A368N4W1_9GAMM|nr:MULTISPECIES: RNA polymerase sigma factor FliA [Corallincola]RCU44555.1 RNA polymerase sigma factor FliA [Corallincola holothuriorum]TAA40300.1 RNA polymerase sigma factor FliA [Corallincola spongiicola]TCI05393.1 RNA polymerase sigma factor FliA [Corallincola luteus]